MKTRTEWILIPDGKIPADVPGMQMIEIALSDYRRFKLLARFAEHIDGLVLAYRIIKQEISND